MLSPCQLLTLLPIGCAAAVIGIAAYETRQQRKTVIAKTIAAADAQTAKWMQWNQETSEDETVIEPLDDSPMPLDQDDRAHAQALMLPKAIAIWLEGESTHYSVEAEIAIRELAGALRTQGIAVLEQDQ